MKVPGFVMNLFEIGKKYKIITFNPDFGYSECKCVVKNKTDESIFVDIFEPSWPKACWISWNELDTVEEI
ncbi:hypothetical protein [Bacillus cereus]|uniref:Uncharacterized protein n=1 Tax=Bacillus cereus TIAC219 TaxID=718222 RepID=A0ABC9STH5_BACCE|nr:hypothetical protein [Bacillus cereus]EJP84664.1 hypothetical protein IC1_05192 [Bacillus cereus VD022]EOQ59347.1 hypothetical protein IAY_05099 [Bacillus cereus TIAC219]